MITKPTNGTFTTFTIFRYASQNRWWALKQMGVAPQRLSITPGLKFFKFMGSGQGLVFSVWPDWTRYALIATWSTPEHASTFFEKSSFIREFRQRTTEIWTVQMLPTKSHGLWSGVNPFDALASPIADNQPIAVLTRASIRVQALKPFWSYALQSADSLEKASGLIFSCGVGELPFIRQATFSIWESATAMKNYAYQGKQHKETMRRKQQGNWYWEELFARFELLGAEGSYLGKNPVENILTML